jgi:hypothetical protein
VVVEPVLKPLKPPKPPKEAAGAWGSDELTVKGGRHARDTAGEATGAGAGEGIGADAAAARPRRFGRPAILLAP